MEIFEIPKTVVIDRKKWLRATEGIVRRKMCFDSGLRVGNRYCCLGLACLQAGVKSKFLTSVGGDIIGEPSELVRENGIFVEGYSTVENCMIKRHIFSYSIDN